MFSSPHSSHLLQLNEKGSHKKEKDFFLLPNTCLVALWALNTVNNTHANKSPIVQWSQDISASLGWALDSKFHCVCVCVCGLVGVWVSEWVSECVCVCACMHACMCACMRVHLLHNHAWTLADIYIMLFVCFSCFFLITFSILMSFICVLLCLFSALSHRVGTLQISIIIITQCHSLFLLPLQQSQPCWWYPLHSWCPVHSRSSACAELPDASSGPAAHSGSSRKGHAQPLSLCQSEIKGNHSTG